MHLRAASGSVLLPPSITASANPLAALVSDAWRHLTIGDPSDDYLAELAAAFLAAADEYRDESPSLLILANAIANLIDSDRRVTPVLHALQFFAQVLG